VLAALGQGLYEREEVVRLALLSALAGESIFLLGVPGVGKSLIARRLKLAFKEGKSFEYLMTKFSTPDEVFGPISIKKLREDDAYERLTENYMPDAHIVFLDEIWKSSSAIQNALLTIINERVFRNGDREEKVAIKAIITASNELPPKGESFGPIWDRLLLRYELRGIQNDAKFLEMITDTEDVYEIDLPQELAISATEMENWSKEIDAVKIPETVLHTIQVIRAKLEDYNGLPENAKNPILIHDRRWKKIIRLVRASAFFNDRKVVDLMDCFLMVHCLWSQRDQIPVVQEMVAETIRKHGYSLAVDLQMLRRELSEFQADVKEEIEVVHRTAEPILRPYDSDYYKLVKDMETFEGQYVRIVDFNKLSIGSSEVVNFYDQDFKLVNRLKAAKGEGSFELLVYHNSTEQRYQMLTHEKESVKVLYKRPHSLVQKHWEKRYTDLLAYITEQELRLSAEFPDELHGLAENLFIQQDLAQLVRANLDEVIQSLRDVKLALEKVHHSYSSLPQEA